MAVKVMERLQAKIDKASYMELCKRRMSYREYGDEAR
jgi:hypothetical protein